MAERTSIRMTAAEFLNQPESNQIYELLDGEPIMSPAPEPVHQKVSRAIFRFLDATLQVSELIYAPAVVYLDDENVVQPDIFWASENGHCKVVKKYWQGAPDLIVEILSPSTSPRDRGYKFELYEKHGVREYWLIDPDARFVEVYALQDGKFVRIGLYEPDGTFDSPVLDGHTVQVTALFA